MGPPHWPAYPAGGRFGRLSGSATAIAWLGARLMAHDLSSVGINVDCAPVLDVPVPGAHDVIGDRAYGTTPESDMDAEPTGPPHAAEGMFAEFTVEAAATPAG